MPSRSSPIADREAPLSLPAQARIAGRVALLLLALISHAPLHYLSRLFGLRDPWPTRFLKLAAQICGARLRSVGRPAAAPVLFVANHQSWIDILALGGVARTAFVSKAEVGAAPLIGHLADMNRTVYIDRGERMNVAGQVEKLRSALVRLGRLAIFPEGTTGDGLALLPFKPALFALLDPPPPGALVQPVWLDYGPERVALAWTGAEPALHHIRRILGRRGRFPLTIHFLEAFEPTRFAGRKAIAAEAERRIAAAMAKPAGVG